jgi:hypothetical protein
MPGGVFPINVRYWPGPGAPPVGAEPPENPISISPEVGEVRTATSATTP